MSHLFNNIFFYPLVRGPRFDKKIKWRKKHVFKSFTMFLNIAYRFKITNFNRPIFSVCQWKEFFLTVSQNNIL